MSPEALADYLEAARRIRRRAGRSANGRASRSRRWCRCTSTARSRTWIAILDIARDYGLLVVEDACQAQGAEYRSRQGGWRRAGSFGKAAAFSFYPGQEPRRVRRSRCGDDRRRADWRHRSGCLREHGQSQKYYHDLEGYNGRLDAIQAAFLRIKLRHLDAWNAQRRANASVTTTCLERADADPFCRCRATAAVFHLYVIRCPTGTARGTL